VLNKELELSLNDAFKNAHQKRHEFITVEHLLLAMMDNKEARDVFIASGGDLELMKAELTAYLDESTPVVPEGLERETQPTLGFQRVLQRAVFHVQSSGKKEVSGANVLVAIFSEQDSQAVYLMNRQNVTRLDVVNFISHGIAKVDEDDDGSDFEEVHPVDAEEPANDSLTKYTVNLNDQAKAGKIDPLIGREKELERTIQTLCRRRKNNPLLVGNALDNVSWSQKGCHSK